MLETAAGVDFILLVPIYAHMMHSCFPFGTIHSQCSPVWAIFALISTCVAHPDVRQLVDSARHGQCVLRAMLAPFFVGSYWSMFGVEVLCCQRGAPIHSHEPASQTSDNRPFWLFSGKRFYRCYLAFRRLTFRQVFCTCAHLSLFKDFLLCVPVNRSFST